MPPCVIGLTARLCLAAPIKEVAHAIQRTLSSGAVGAQGRPARSVAGVTADAELKRWLTDESRTAVI